MDKLDIKDLSVTVLAIIGALTVLNGIILVAPGIIDLLLWVVVIVIGVLFYNHFANKNKGDKK